MLLLDATGDAGVLPFADTVTLSSSPAEVYFSLDGGCSGTAAQVDQVVPAGTSSLAFWVKPWIPDTIALQASDLRGALSPATATLTVAIGPPTQIAFPASTFEIYVGTQANTGVGFLDAYGNYSPIAQPELLTVQSADPDAGLLLNLQQCPPAPGPTQATVPAGTSNVSLCMGGARGTYTAVATTPDYGSATATVNICPGPGATCASAGDCCSELQCSGARCCFPSGAYSVNCGDCCSQTCISNNPPTCL